MRKLLIVALVALLAGCGQGLDGTYSDPAGMVRYTFESEGKVTVEVLGKPQQTTYIREGDALRVKAPDADAADVAFTIDKDGALQGPMGVRLEKQKQ